MMFPVPEQSRNACARLGALLLAIVLVTGCAGDEGRSATVSGRVTLDGAPVPAGTVLFMTDDGHGASAELQPDGTYTLKCRPDRFKVAVTPPEPGDPEAGPAGESSQGAIDISQRYFDVGSSGLTIEVTKGNNTFDIALTR